MVLSDKQKKDIYSLEKEREKHTLPMQNKEWIVGYLIN